MTALIVLSLFSGCSGQQCPPCDRSDAPPIAREAPDWSYEETSPRPSERLSLARENLYDAGTSENCLGETIIDPESGLEIDVTCQ